MYPRSDMSFHSSTDDYYLRSIHSRYPSEYNRAGLFSTILPAATVEFSYDPHELPQPLDETAVPPNSTMVPRWYSFLVVVMFLRTDVSFPPWRVVSLLFSNIQLAWVSPVKKTTLSIVSSWTCSRRRRRLAWYPSQAGIRSDRSTRRLTHHRS